MTTQSVTVTFVKDEYDESTEPVPYELEVKNYCTDGVVAGVTVYLDGIEMGQTDSSGIISLGALVPGSTHTLRMIKDGYMDSDTDSIDNASFSVPETTS